MKINTKIKHGLSWLGFMTQGPKECVTGYTITGVTHLHQIKKNATSCYKNVILALNAILEVLPFLCQNVNFFFTDVLIFNFIMLNRVLAEISNLNFTQNSPHFYWKNREFCNTLLNNNIFTQENHTFKKYQHQEKFIIFE